jgi:mono/diheme cytochrome c family protein
MAQRLRVAVLVLLALSLAGGLVLRHLRTRHLGAVERGRRLASESGCFNCHGPGGNVGWDDPGEGVGGVPPWSNEMVTAYAKTEDEIREWIADGGPRRIRESAPTEADGASLLQMPPYGKVLSGAQIADLVAYVKAVSDFAPPPEGPAREGQEVATRLGCFSCHGPQGRASPPNPGSLFGYIPSWDGEDWPELVKDDAELRAWILDGRPDRLRDHPVARFFLDRQVIRMPGYRGKVTDQDLEKLLAYLRWLRSARG